MFSSGNGQFAPRSTHQHVATAASQRTSRAYSGPRQARRVRGRGQSNARLPFAPPETWHEPRTEAQGYRIVVQEAGSGFRHVVSAEEIRARLAQLPPEMTAQLQVVQLSSMTRKKKSLPMYGMQWGRTLYLYPIEAGLIETYHATPRPAELNEARMWGGRWERGERGIWRLIWTEAALKDFYLNNILLHELAHLLDDRNTNTVDRERYAEWFAVHYGYRPTLADRRASAGPVVVRHGRK